MKLKITTHFSSSLEARSLNLKAGFSLIEILLAVTILAIVSAVGVASLSNVNRDNALSVETEKILSLLAEGRAQTLSQKGGAAYGVHFEERKAVLFKGSVYSAGDTENRVQLLNDVVKISAISLSGGGSDVLFKKLTGATTQSGTVTIAALQSSSQTKVITIAGTGMAYSN